MPEGATYTFSLQTPVSIRRVIEEGERRLAAESGLDRPSLRQIVWHLFQDAMHTCDVLPDRERGWLLSGERSHWPEIAMTAKDAYVAEIERLQDGIAPPPLKKLRNLDPAAITRMLETMAWCSYIRAGRPDRPDLAMTLNNRRLFLALASGVKPRHLKRHIGVRGQSRSLLYTIKSRCLSQIEAGLASEHGVGAGAVDTLC